MPEFALIHPNPKPDAVGLGLRAVIETAQRAEWNAKLYNRDDKISHAPDLIGFSLYTPLRFPDVPAWLRKNGLATRTANRPASDPVIIAGGAAAAAAAPIACFIDALALGDAEVSLPGILSAIRNSRSKSSALDAMTELPNVYVPGRSTNPAKWCTSNMISSTHWENRILAARGCRYSCPFCQVTKLHAPYRPTPRADLLAKINATQGRLSFSAAAFSHHPHVLEITALLASQGRYLNSVNACHRDLTPEIIQALAAVSGRIGIGVEGTTAPLRRRAGKTISDHKLEALLLKLLANFGVVSIYIIIGLPSETKKDQVVLINLLHRVLDRRSKNWKGNPGRLQITSTPFQALPHTKWEHEAAPPHQLIEHWREAMKKMRQRYEYFFPQNIKSPHSADILFGLHRATEDWDPIIEELGPTRANSTWSTWRQKKFLRLANERGLTLNLGPLATSPWAKYSLIP